MSNEHIPGAVCGSGDLNRRFRDFAIEKLKDAEYPNKDKVRVDKMVDKWLMPKFEQETKRSFSLKFKNKGNRRYAFPLMGLQGVEGNSRLKDDSFGLSL